MNAVRPPELVLVDSPSLERRQRGLTAVVVNLANQRIMSSMQFKRTDHWSCCRCYAILYL